MDWMTVIEILFIRKNNKSRISSRHFTVSTSGSQYIYITTIYLYTDIPLVGFGPAHPRVVRSCTNLLRGTFPIGPHVALYIRRENHSIRGALSQHNRFQIVIRYYMLYIYILLQRVVARLMPDMMIIQDIAVTNHQNDLTTQLIFIEFVYHKACETFNGKIIL